MLELMPDGETFKKLTRAEGSALHRYYKREKDGLLDKTLPPLISTGIPSIVAIGIAAAAYVFKDELQEELREAGQSFIDWAGTGLFNFSIGNVSSVILRTTGPSSSQYIILEDGTKVELTRCQRWESDLYNIVEGGQKALLPIYIKAMKEDGCSKPGFITKQNWDKV